VVMGVQYIVHRLRGDSPNLTDDIGKAVDELGIHHQFG
jgi:hypothetical protein